MAKYKIKDKRTGNFLVECDTIDECASKLGYPNVSGFYRNKRFLDIEVNPKTKDYIRSSAKHLEYKKWQITQFMEFPMVLSFQNRSFKYKSNNLWVGMLESQLKAYLNSVFGKKYILTMLYDKSGKLQKAKNHKISVELEIKFDDTDMNNNFQFAVPVLDTIEEIIYKFIENEKYIMGIDIADGDDILLDYQADNSEGFNGYSD